MPQALEHFPTQDPACPPSKAESTCHARQAHHLSLLPIIKGRKHLPCPSSPSSKPPAHHQRPKRVIESQKHQCSSLSALIFGHFFPGPSNGAPYFLRMGGERLHGSTPPTHTQTHKLMEQRAGLSMHVLLKKQDHTHRLHAVCVSAPTNSKGKARGMPHLSASALGPPRIFCSMMVPCPPVREE